MIYLILDTNTWIYLANSKDPLTENFHDGLHFKLFEKLAKKVKDGSVQILINYLIKEEWERNKQHASGLVIKYENKLKSELAFFENIRKTINGKYNDELEKIKIEYQGSINTKIRENKTHIANVDQLLNSSIEFKVSIEIKAFAADWSVEKKAPFKGEKKNSMADALILFSAIEYIKTISTINLCGEDVLIDLPTSIFVSGNKGDFCSAKDDEIIHEDLEPHLSEVKMWFFRSLPSVLNFIDNTLFKETEIKEIEQEMDEFFEYEDDSCYCEICTFDDENQYINIVYFSNPEEILNEDEEAENPDQLKLELGLTPEVKKREITTTVQRGYCSWCNTEHIKCQNCGEVTAITVDIGDTFECEGCGLIYMIMDKYVGNEWVEKIKIVSSNSDNDSSPFHW